MNYEHLNLDPALDGKVWYMRKRTSQTFAPHVHRELEFNIVTAGHAEYIVKGRKFSLTPNTLIWLFPNQKHVLINASENFEMFIGVFKPKLLKLLVKNGADKTLISLDYKENEPKQIEDFEAKNFINVLKDITSINSDNTFYNSYLSTICLKTWYIFKNTANKSISQKIPEVIEKCLHILDNPQNKMTLESISEDLGYSPSQISRLFKQHTGTSIVDFRNKKRLDYVANVMASEKMNITKVAFDAGFGSYAQFHRIFKEYFGYSPNEFIRRLKIKNSK